MSKQSQLNQDSADPIRKHICKGCQLEFPSKSAIFRHLKETNAICLPQSDRIEYFDHSLKHQKLEKAILLYGYWIPPILNDHSSSNNNYSSDKKDIIRNGEDVAQLIVALLEHEQSDLTSLSSSNSTSKVNRSYGHSRSIILAQEDGTSAITEVLLIKLVPLTNGSTTATTTTHTNSMVQQWIDQVNQKILKKLQSTSSRAIIKILGRQGMSMSKFNAETDVSHRRMEYLLPAEFVIPKPLLTGLPTFTENFRRSGMNPYPSTSNMMDADDTFSNIPVDTNLVSSSYQRPSDETLDVLTKYKRLMKQLTTHVIDLDVNDAAAVFEKQFHNSKRQRHRDHNNNNKKNINRNGNGNGSSSSNDKCNKPFRKKKFNAESNDCDHLNIDDAVLNNSDSQFMDSSNISDKRKKHSKKVGIEIENNDKHDTTSATNVETPKVIIKNDKILRRKRYHNFTPTVMAHEYLSYRRMDRFYHRATFRLDDSSTNDCANPTDGKMTQQHQAIPFLALSLSGDMFLSGQVCRVIGLFVALACKLIDDDIIDCVFDETYPHLVPTPPLPNFAQYPTDVYYISIEGKVKAILTPRKIDRYENGWNDDATIQRVRDWQSVVRTHVAKTWIDQGINSDGSLLIVRTWMDTVLKPWTIKASEQLKHYRTWKKDLQTSGTNIIVVNEGLNISFKEALDNVNDTKGIDPKMPLSCRLDVDSSVPAIYEKVLFYLRQADESGLWPSTTPKRQLVMMSNIRTTSDEAIPLSSSLSMAHSKAKNNKISKSSAYVFVEGQGGASGSFSLGAMPGDKCLQPKGNTLFPELMDAAFKLEMALFPNREPSSTIAVNRNAQFRPHTDSGAGAGQSTSLIVGLGTYSGGELVVEGNAIDIRYKPIEFDGWKQRHWTMPFQGERFSLVWFTPKGCEGINFVH